MEGGERERERERKLTATVDPFFPTPQVSIIDSATNKLYKLKTITKTATTISKVTPNAGTCVCVCV